MDQFWKVLDAINGVIWHDYVLFTVLGVGVLFTLWSGIGQFRALTHGFAVVRGKYDDKNDPGAINHFQALSAALSATVGLGNIAGVSVAVALGGPGAVFWMWMVGIFGMALKMTEVTQSMLFRNTDDPDNPHGGPMFVAHKGFKKWGLGPIGAVIGGIFVVTLLISAITGGNMFQVWNVAEVTRKDFGVPIQVTGIILAVVTGLVIIGGIKRIGAVAGRLVPFMCVIYLLAAFYAIAMNIEVIPAMLKLIVVEAFSPTKAEGAFLGGTFGYAILWGMKRALFSSEAGQGSSPIAHSAAKTDEPVREGIVAGLEPFIDTIVVCTLTALVILSTGVWNRDAETRFPESTIQVVPVGGEAGRWTLSATELPPRDDNARRIEGDWQTNADFKIYMIAEIDTPNKNTGTNLAKFSGSVSTQGDRHIITWDPINNPTAPRLTHTGVFVEYPGASLTSHAFNTVAPGMGKWIVVIACWLFAVSTIISWSYYGEQGVVYLFGTKAIMPYKLIYCLLILVASAGFITTDAELDNLTALGTGVMLWANIPIMLIFGPMAMKAYKQYIARLKSGELDLTAHTPASITDIAEGKDIK